MPLITFSDKVDSKVSTVPIINKIVANDINQLKDGVNANETAISAINGTTYTSLVQLLTQSATNAPVATEVYNNTGETYTWSYVSSGVYRITSTNTPFTINKTVVFLNNGSTVTNGLEPRWNRISNTIIDIFTPNESMTKGSFEIKIYS